MARPRSKLTEKQGQYVEKVLSGQSPTKAARSLGTNPTYMANCATIRTQIEAARRWLTDTTQIKRLDVVCGILDSIEMARMMSDPAGVRQGWVEIAKILGHFAPEKKIIDLNINDQRMLSKFESLSDEDLLRLAQGITVDGEATHLQ